MVSTQISAASRRRWYEPPPLHALRRRWRIARLHRAGRRLVFIAGCARSGTSLLKQLMTEFDDTAVCPRERPIWHFLEMADRPESSLVVKRTSECHRGLERLPAAVDLIYCVRHPYDCLTSAHPQTLHLRPFHVTRERWLAEYEALGRLRCEQPWRGITVVRYEDLVTRPDDVQATIAAATGLRSQGTFSVNSQGIEIRSVSLEKWRQRPELRGYLAGLDAGWQAEIGRFCAEFGYGPPPPLP
ncbi:MAG: sulfotransferase [Planctomycetaceae bacterium]